jgi:hypothetical protein
MGYVFIIGLIFGLTLLALIVRRIVSWPRPLTAATMLGCALYGGLPFILLRAGAIEATALLNILAGLYLLVFTIVGSLVLNSRLERRTD